MKVLIVMRLLSLFFMVLFSKCSKPLQKGDYTLLPTPQKFRITGDSKLSYMTLNSYYIRGGDVDIPVFFGELKNIKLTSSEKQAQIILSIDSNIDLKSEGYMMNISKDKVLIKAKDKKGLFYAMATLSQMVEDSKQQHAYLPICDIKDYPSLSYRAIHLDVKHHLEKETYYYHLIDKLASYKINAIILEIEDKLKYKRQPIVGSSDAFTIQQWKDISDYAMERNIEISPLVQGIGHASFVLKHEKYKPLRDDPKSDWAFNPLEPKTYQVQYDLYLDAMQATPHGRFLHIGGDEVHTTAKGSKKSALELQLIWLDKVCKFAKKHNRIPIFWDDMPLKHAGVYSSIHKRDMTESQVEKIWKENEHKLLKFLDKFPKNCIYMRWNYKNPQTFGNHKAMQWFKQRGFKVMGATAGQTRWVLMPQDDGNIENIQYFCLQAIKSHSEGILLTLWDDDSPHFELYNRGILAFAEYTWVGDKKDKQQFKSAYRHREFSYKLSDEKYSFINKLEEIVGLWKNILLKGNRRNYLKAAKDNAMNDVIDLPDSKQRGAWSKSYKKKIELAKKSLKASREIGQIIKQMKLKAVRNIYTLEVYSQVNTLVAFTNKIILQLHQYDIAVGDNKEREFKKLKNLKVAFQKLRQEFEKVYSQTRQLNKPDDYILDQDHHVHLANQTKNFDWQFYAEILFFKKLENKR